MAKDTGGKAKDPADKAATPADKSKLTGTMPKAGADKAKGNGDKGKETAITAKAPPEKPKEDDDQENEDSADETAGAEKESAEEATKDGEKDKEAEGDGKGKGKGKKKKAKKAKPAKVKAKVKVAGVWGIDLGQCALKAVRLEMKDGEVTATAFDYIEHPKILSQPDADPDQLTREALEGFLKRNDLRGDMVVISVPGQSGLARFVKLPPVEEKKIDAIVTFEAKQQIPFPLEEVVWDYQRIGRGTVSDGFALESEVGLFAMKRDMVNRALQQFKDVNVEVHVVQMSPLALCNFVAFDQLKEGADTGPAAEGDAEEKVEDKDCIVALDIGTDNSNLVITDGHKIIWQRPIPLGGNHFTRTLTKEMKLTFAKAEHIKRNAIKSPDLRKILTALRPVLNDFVNEVQRSLGYFTNTHRSATVGHMIGLGNVFRLPGLQKFLQEKLALDVRKLNKFDRLHGDAVVNAPQFTENIMSFAVAYGLALQGLKAAKIQTNLLPQEIRTERMVRAKKPWAAAAAAALLLAAGGLTFGRSLQYKTVTSPDVDKAIKSVAEVQTKINTTNNDYKKEKDKVEASIKAVSNIQSTPEDRLNWILVYKYINDCLPRPWELHLASDTDQAKYPLNTYFDQKAMKARADWTNKHNPKPGEAPPAPDPKKDAEILQNLIQINIEGVNCLYTDDLETYFKGLARETNDFVGNNWIHEKDKELIQGKGGDAKLPKKGWVFEVRGYTFHQDREQFVINTLVANLRFPDKMKIALDAEGKNTVNYKAPDDVKKKVQDKVSQVCLYRFELDNTPVATNFKLVGSSHLNDVLGTGPGKGGGGGTFKPPAGTEKSGDKDKGDAPKGPSRAGWSPVGETAANVLGSGAGGGPGGFGKKPGGPGFPVVTPPTNPEQASGQSTLPPRLEFVVFFIWQEPLAQADDSGSGGNQ